MTLAKARVLAVPLAYLGLAVIPYWGFWAAGGAGIAGKGGDPALFSWFIDWVGYALVHGHNPLLTDWGNYPFGVNGVTNTSVPLLGVLGVPVTLAFGAFATTTLFFTLAFPLSALSGYLLARRWVRWRPAAFAGGLLYGFSPYLAGQGLGHLHMVFVPLPPLIFWVLSEMAAPGLIKGWGRLGMALALLCTAQFFISAEVLASTAVVGAIGLGVAAAVSPRAARERWRFVARALGVACAATVVLLGYPVWLLVAGPARIMGPAQRTSLYRGNLLATVIPDSAMRFRVPALLPLANTFSGNTSENGLYLGLPLLVIGVAGAVALWSRPVMRVAALTTLAALVLSLGSRLTVGHYLWRAVPLPEAALNSLPVLDNTIAARYSLYVMLGAAVMLALICEAVSNWPGPPAAAGTRSRLAAGALACLALIPLVPAWPYAARVAPVPRYFAADTAIPSGSVAALYPFPSGSDVTGMLWQVAAGMRFKSPGGRFLVPGTRTVVGQDFALLAQGQVPARTAAQRSALLAQLRAWRVRTVLVQPAGSRPALVMPFFEWMLGRPPDVSSGGISAWYDVS